MMQTSQTFDDRFSGVLSPVIMPYKQDYSPDAKRLAKQCHWLLSNNVGLALFGTNSEGNSLSVGEKISLMDYLVNEGIDPSWLMPGTGCCALSDTIELTAHAVKIGSRGVLMLPPFFYKDISEEGLYASYSETIEKVGSSDLRIYLYNIPPVANITIDAALIERLLKNYPNIIAGIKDSSGIWANTKTMLDCRWNNFRVFVGSESFLLPNMKNGGSGCISATANVNPAAIEFLYSNWTDERAGELQNDLNKVRSVFSRYPMIPALKKCVAHFLEDTNWQTVRPPLVQLSEDQQKYLIKDLKLIGFEMSNLKID